MKNKKRIAAMVMTGLILCSFPSTIAEAEEKGLGITYNGVPIEEAIGTASGMFADAVEENMSEMIDGLNDVFSEFAQGFSESLGEIEDAFQTDTTMETFCYSNSGSSTYEIYSYEVMRNEENGEQMVICEFHCGNETYELPADEELMQELQMLIDQHELRKWDGFSQTDSTVLDGSGFFLNITFADGSGITAHGSNSFPDGFSDAKSAIDELFISYLEKSGITPDL